MLSGKSFVQPTVLLLDLETATAVVDVSDRIDVVASGLSGSRNQSGRRIAGDFPVDGADVVLFIGNQHPVCRTSKDRVPDFRGRVHRDFTVDAIGAIPGPWTIVKDQLVGNPDAIDW